MPTLKQFVAQHSCIVADKEDDTDWRYVFDIRDTLPKGEVYTLLSNEHVVKGAHFTNRIGYLVVTP